MCDEDIHTGEDENISENDGDSASELRSDNSEGEMENDSLNDNSNYYTAFQKNNNKEGRKWQKPSLKQTKIEQKFWMHERCMNR